MEVTAHIIIVITPYKRCRTNTARVTFEVAEVLHQDKGSLLKEFITGYLDAAEGPTSVLEYRLGATREYTGKPSQTHASTSMDP